MLKNLLMKLFIISLFVTAVNAQWQFDGIFPADTLVSGAHGLAVDPDGKVWYSDFYAVNIIDGADTVTSRAIFVINPDGTQASFSPIWRTDIGGDIDTLLGSARGMRADVDGNILYTDGNQMMYEFDYVTGAALRKVNLELGTSPTSPAVDDNGTIFVGPVVPGNPIKMFDQDFNFIGNALDATKGFSRAFAVSGDGNTIYWAGYTLKEVVVFNRADEFSSYDSVGTILEGFNSESFDWDPKSGALWASAGSYLDVPGNGYTPGAWYAYDVTNKKIVDSLKWQFTNPGSADERPRAIGFAPDGNTAYVGVFRGSGPALPVQKFTRNTTPVDITFNVNMAVQIESGFDPATETVYLAGSFNDWSNSANQLTDTDGDKIYSGTITAMDPGERVYFKFIRNQDGWENDPNREYVVGSNGNQYTAFFNNDLGGGLDISLTFDANMELEIAAGRFNPSTDTLSVRGSMNGWGSSDIMTASTLDPNVYSVTIDSKLNVDDLISYKFAYVSSGATTWENDPNNEYTVTSDDINAGFIYLSRGFNNATLDDVTGQEVAVTFVVDMNGAVNALTNTPFGTVTSVAIFGAVAPLAWPDGGWPTEQENLAHFLNDSGTDGDAAAGDGFWSTTLTFPKYTLLNFDYKYGANWGDVANTTGNDNEATTGVNHSIPLQTNYVSVTANDEWADMAPTTLSDIVTGVEVEDNNIPTQFTLEQNFPNPFNPTTVIKFSLPEASMVSLRVYNVLGQEVATLLNENMNSGTYSYNFDASNLTSGIYIYTVNAGQYSATKKMMLVK